MLKRLPCLSAAAFTFTLFFSSGPARAQVTPAATTHGIITGMGLLYLPNNGGAMLTPGAGYINGKLINVRADPAWRTEPFSAWCYRPAASTAYYVYIVDNGVATLNPPFLFTPATLSWVCSTIGPQPDGHPRAAISGANPGDEALFVGSFLTDANSHMIPFYRDGDSMLLSTQTNQADFLVGTYSCVWPNVGTDAVQMNPLVPFPVESSNTSIVNTFIQGTDPVSHRACYLDPGANLPVGAGAAKACQAEMSADISDAKPHADTSAQLRVVMSGDARLTVYTDEAALREQIYLQGQYQGYVESAKNPVSRCGPSGNCCIPLNISSELESCSVDSDCCAGDVTTGHVAKCASGQCCIPGGSRWPCDGTASCCAGAQCVAGNCCTITGGSCGSPADCCSGVCTASKCG